MRFRTKGFSLLEVLVVLLVLSVMATLVAPKIGGINKQTRIEKESRALQQALQGIIDESWLNGKNVFLKRQGQQLQVWQVVSGQWQMVSIAYEFDTKLRYDFRLDAQNLDHAQTALGMSQKADWLVLENGEYLAFSIKLGSSNQWVTLSGDGINRVVIQ